MMKMRSGLARQAGVSMIETLLVFPVMLLIGLGIVHLGLVYQAKSNLEYAALMAARVGAATSININLMKQEVINRMRPSLIGSDTINPSITILNPTQAMFSSCGVVPTDGTICGSGVGNTCVIPNFGLQYRPTTQDCDGVSIQDANILRIKVTFPFRSHIPFMNLRLFSSDTHNTHTNALGDNDPGVPISAVATVRMQSDPHFTANNSGAWP